MLRLRMTHVFWFFVASVILSGCHGSDRGDVSLTEPILNSASCTLGTEGEIISAFPSKHVHEISLSTAVSTALEKSFQSRIEFEKRYQAKKRIQKAYVNLIPHVSGAAISAVMSPSFLGVVGAIGDLLPFLLPTNWFQIDQTKIMSQIENETQTLMQFDLAFEIEGLAYSLWRDQAIQSAYIDSISLIKSTYCKVRNLENQKLMVPGSSDHLQSTFDSLIRDESVIEQLINEDERALSLVLGQSHDQGVVSIAPLAVESLPDSVATVNSNTALNLVRAQSHELLQLDLMVELADSRRKAAFFSWMDPSGFYAGGLSSGLGIMRSQEHIMMIQREQAEAELLSKYDDTVERFNQAVQFYAFDQDDLVLQDRRLNRILNAIVPGSEMSTTDVTGIINDRLVSEVVFQSHLAEFRVNRAMLNRFLGQGFYRR